MVLLDRDAAGETRALTWADFDRETWTMRLHARDAKSGHGRALALVEDLRAVMEGGSGRDASTAA